MPTSASTTPPRRSGNRRRLAAGVACAVVLVALFLAMHSGARGEAVCTEHGLASAGSAPSLIPPGAGCVGGAATGDVVKFDGSFLIVTPSIYLVLGLLELLASGVRRRRFAGLDQ
jgi:hypothetical protein